jgi:hypothetical protein
MLRQKGADPGSAATDSEARKCVGVGERDRQAFSPIPNCQQADLIGASLQWKRAGSGWRLFDDRRCMGEVVPDSTHRGMWRVVLSGARLSDYANLSWARNAVLEAATRELAYEARHPATDPRKCPENGGVFSRTAPPMRSPEKTDPEPGKPYPEAAP